MPYLHALPANKFCELIENQIDLTSWWIKDDTAQNRLRWLKDKPYFIYLKEQSQKQNIFSKDEEILSWIDTMNLLYRTLNEINKNILKNIFVYQEYQIPFNTKRADYLLTHNNQILIIEFSFDKMKNKEKYENKLTQAMEYKELLSSILPNNVEIATYTFLIEADMSKYGEKKFVESTFDNKHNYEEDLITINEIKIKNLIDFINHYFYKDYEIANKAIKELEIGNYIEKYPDKITANQCKTYYVNKSNKEHINKTITDIIMCEE